MKQEFSTGELGGAVSLFATSGDDGKVRGGNGRAHGVAGGDSRHDRRVGDAQIGDPMNFQLSIDHRHLVAAHLRRPRFVPVGGDGTAEVAFKFCSCQVAWHDLPFDERTTVTFSGGRFARSASVPNYAFDNNTLMLGVSWRF